ncbi:MAG: hypothetical protein NVS3B17_00480 [Vulcanimicrobiaceae bacterium]
MYHKWRERARPMTETLRGTLRTIVVVVALVAITIGVTARTVALDTPLFWQDETYTALRVTGHLQEEYMRLYDGRVHTVADVRTFETLQPGRGVPAVVSALAREDPHHSPLFYALDRVWVGAFGTSAAGFRGLSVALGIAGIGLIFALATTLARSRLAGAVTASLFAVSPIFVVYARQAREYALFACVVMLATLALLRALRTGGLVAWAPYAACVTLGFYVDPIFSLIVVAHGVSVGWEPGASPQRVRRVGTWLATVVVGLVPFLPWAYNAYASRDNISDQLGWGESAYPLKAFLQKWAFNAGALFFDGEFKSLALAPIAIGAIIAAVALVVLFVRYAPRDAVRMVVPLGACAFVTIVGRDIVYHSHFSVIARYLTPFWLAIVLACGIVLARGIRIPLGRSPAIALGTLIALVSAGTASIAIRGASENWWDNNDQVAYQALARVIDRSPNPLIVSQFHPHVPLVLARYLHASDGIVLFRGAPPTLPIGRDAFVVEPSDAVLGEFERRRYELVNVSPAKQTIITSFHRDALKLTQAQRRDPDAALWLVRPQRIGHRSNAAHSR